MKLKDMIEKSKEKNTFTIIRDDETCILLFEGRTIMASGDEDFHSGHDSAYFNGIEISKSWKSPLSLYSRIVSQFKIKAKVVEHSTDENLYEFLNKHKLYSTDNVF